MKEVIISILSLLCIFIAAIILETVFGAEIARLAMLATILTAIVAAVIYAEKGE